MIGVILAAGIGSRLRPMTDKKPKCLVKSAGKAMLQYQLDAYKAAGINDLVIVVGYEGEAIREYCKHIKDFSITIVENKDYETTNNMYSLYLAKKYFCGKSFILNNADLTVDKSIIKDVVEFPSPSCVAVDVDVYNEESMKVSIDDGKKITDISKKIYEEKSYGCSIDIYKFGCQASKVFAEKITDIVEGEGNRKDWTEVALQRLFNNNELEFFPCDISGKKWVEIDDYHDLLRSDRLFSNFSEINKSIDTYIVDLDGTLYVGSEKVEGADKAISTLRASGKKIYFLTNNSSKNKSDYVNKLSQLNFSAREEDIIMSTDYLLRFLKDKKVQRLHVLGTSSFKSVLSDHGFDVHSSEPEYVVLGYDTELTYGKLVDACGYLNRGVDLLATHSDSFCPSEHGPIPDIGAMISMIEVATGVKPIEVFGKPRPDYLSDILRGYGVDFSRAAVVGDRLHTDVELANRLASKSVLVLTGETSRDMVDSLDKGPTYVLESIADFIDAL